MKNHLVNLFGISHKRLTFFLMLSSVILILAAALIGINDNLPGLFLLLTGIIFLFFAFLHPWRKWKSYAWLAGISVGIIGLTFLTILILAALNLERYISEGIVLELIVLVPGIIVGISGAIFWACRTKLPG